MNQAVIAVFFLISY